MLRYLFESSAWSLGGLVLGYLVGRTEQDVREIKKKLGIGDDHT